MAGTRQALPVTGHIINHHYCFRSSTAAAARCCSWTGGSGVFLSLRGVGIVKGLFAKSLTSLKLLSGVLFAEGAALEARPRTGRSSSSSTGRGEFYLENACGAPCSRLDAKDAARGRRRVQRLLCAAQGESTAAITTT